MCGSTSVFGLSLPKNMEVADAIRMRSHLIIHRSHGNLEPMIREIFEGEEDVHVMVDRRWHERRQIGAGVCQENNRRLHDRRASAPMVVVLMGGGS